MGLNKIQPQMGGGMGGGGMRRRNPNSMRPQIGGSPQPEIASENGFINSMGRMGGEDDLQSGMTPQGFNQGPTNPTLSGRMRLPAQMAGQTGGNQWNGGAGIIQNKRVPFGGMPNFQSHIAPQGGSDSASDLTTLDNSFMGGKLSSVNTMPGDIRGMRGNLINYLNNPRKMMAQHEPDYERTDIGTGNDITGTYGSAMPNLDRGQIRDTRAGTTDSIDKLGPGSQFMNSINQSLQPVFDQRREHALAQAKETAGNLTGSGFANILGNQVNKSLAEEQATTLDYATRAAQMEQQRQGADADRGLNSQQFNQGSDLGFIQQLLGRSGQGLQADELGLRRDVANQDNTRSYNQFQGNLDSNRLSNIYNTRSGTNNQNAGRFSDNLGRLSTTGVGPNELISSGGAGALAGPLGQLIGGSGGIGGLAKTAGGVLGGIKSIFDRGGNEGGAGVAGLGGQIVRDAAGKLVPAAGLWGAGELAGKYIPGMGGSIAKGAARGAAIGSIIPGVGTGIGAAVGGAVPIAKKAGSWLKKRLSDEQLKENITPLGHGLYEYNFKSQPNREVGFLAQEVRKALPSAVSRHTSGYLQVDYSKTPSILNALSKQDRL